MKPSSIRYIVELWDGKVWREMCEPHQLYLKENGEIPLVIRDPKYGVLRFFGAEERGVFMMERPEVFIIYRGTKPDNEEIA